MKMKVLLNELQGIQERYAELEIIKKLNVIIQEIELHVDEDEIPDVIESDVVYVAPPVAVSFDNLFNTDALKEYEYFTDESFNGDIFHIAKHHLKVDINTCDMKQMVMLLNMSRIVKKGKKGKFTITEKVRILKERYKLNDTQKDIKSKIAEIERDLETELGKYATQQKLNNIKVSTDVVYRQDWINKVNNFVDNLPTFTKKQASALDIFLKKS